MNLVNKYIKLITKNEIYQKYEVFILPIFSVTISLLLLLFVILPQFQRFFSGNRLVTEANQKYDSLNKKVGTLENINTTVYQNNINTSLIALPADQDIPGAISQIIFILSSSKLQLNSIAITNTLNPLGDGAITDYQVRIEASGDTIGLKNFISKIKESPRLMKVNGIDIVQERLTGKIQVVVTIQVYYQSLPSSIGDVEQPISPPSDKEVQILQQIESFSKKTPAVNTSSSTKGKSDPFQ